MSTLKKTIEAEFQRRREKNPRYSQRAFAKFLDVSPATLSRFLRGQQELHPTLANEILRKLMPEDQARQNLILSELGETPPVPFEQEYQPVPTRELAQLDRWYYSAIQELLRSGRKFQNPVQIARALGVEKTIIQEALEILQAHARVQKRNGLYRAIEGRFVASTTQNYASVNQILKGYVSRGYETLDEFDASEVHLSGSTFLASAEKLAECAQMIREFRVKLVRFLEAGSDERNPVLYRMQVHVFPLEVSRDDSVSAK